MADSTPLITNDALVLGILLLVLAAVFVTSGSSRPGFKRFYGIVPSVLLCYFIPGVLASIGLISADHSNLYHFSSRYLLPACLVLLTLSIDLKGVLRLGPKMLIMFFTGTVGVLLGGPVAILIISAIDPSIVGGAGPDAVWRGMTTIAGSWIGGGANQVAMKEVFGVGDGIFGTLVAVDILVSNIWTGMLLLAAGNSERIDRFNGADSSDIDNLRRRIEAYRAGTDRIPSTADTFAVLGVGFGVTALAHLGADTISPWVESNWPWLSRFSLTSPFFWIVVIATTAGLGLSFTRARKLEGVGASRIGTVFLFILVATIGMKMDLHSVVKSPGLYAVGAVWILFHALLMITVARIIRAPVFFLAVGSQANIGGAASAPVVASAFHPSLASVGVLIAVLGYALGTYGAWLCGQIMRAVAPI